MRTYLIPLLLIVLLLSCNRNIHPADAHGNFEADDMIVSSEIGGQIIRFDPREGNRLRAGDTIAIMDTTQLYLQTEQLKATMKALQEKLPDQARQLAVYDQQISKLESDEIRDSNLVQSNAAPKKQLDDIRAALALALRQRSAAKSSLGTETRSILAQEEPLHYSYLAAEDQLHKCYVVNPMDGTVLETYVKAYEILPPGKPLYDIAPLDTLNLRAFIGETQLPGIRVGDSVRVRTDLPQGKGQFQEGWVTWISSQAEFTPKIIQTRDERANLVYAIKIRVPNSGGAIKIGMPAEVYFR